jgi:hypothetical protein
MMISGQYCNAVLKNPLKSSAAGRNGSNRDITDATPSTLAVIASKVRVRSRDNTVSAAMMNTPETTPATTETAITVGVPRPRRLMMPVSPPT